MWTKRGAVGRCLCCRREISEKFKEMVPDHVDMLPERIFCGLDKDLVTVGVWTAVMVVRTIRDTS